ncbi:MAG: CPA1 family monovalent cation:H+ antiporter [Planctomycetota bacterium]|jgi:CPA1 family monovalent cation:H+ antiporter
MDAFALASILLTVAALLAFINRRFIGLPSTIGVMAMALLFSLLLVGIGAVSPAFIESVRKLLEEVNFSDALLDVMLAFLLFAGALHVKLEDLAGQKWIIGTLASVGVVVSTAAVGVLAKVFLDAIGYPMDWLPCFLFGALIAPTDPIAVLGILKSAGVKKSLETKVTGESLFNDGVGVVVFVALLGFATADHAAESSAVVMLFAKEVFGALALGAIFGTVTYWLMRQIDDYLVEVLLSLALCVGVYSLAGALHSSGPLAVVVAGLLIGNQGRRSAMSSLTVQRLDDFWELCDELLNVLLFVLIGLEVLIIPWTQATFVFGLVAIPLTLGVRFLAVGGTVKLLSVGRTFDPGAVRILTWGGLRGGISIALALILRDRLGSGVDIFLTATYVVVVFSIVVQGLTVGRLASRIDRQTAEIAAATQR